MEKYHASQGKKPLLQRGTSSDRTALTPDEIWARATDDLGIAQPMVLPGWNPKGYLNNACHRVAVYVV